MVKQKKITGIILLIIFIGGTLHSFASGRGSITVQVNEEAVGIAGPSMETVFIELDDIDSVQIFDSFDSGKCISGINTEKYQDGIYWNQEFENYHLCVKKSVNAFIVIETDADKYIFNCESEKATDRIYQNLMKRGEKL